MTDAVDQFDEPVLSPEATLVLREIEEATAAAGFPIHGHAKLNAVEDTLVGPDHAPVNLGPTVELTVTIASDGAPLPPPGHRRRNETAAAIMIIRVSPERSFGVLCWRAWVNLVEVSTARAFFSQQSAKADEHWDAAALPLEGDTTDLDSQLDDAVSLVTASLPQTPGEAISQAFQGGAEDGHLVVGLDWDPPIPRLRFHNPESDDEPAHSTLPDAAAVATSDSAAKPPEAAGASVSSDASVSWTSSFALVGVAATIGLIVGLAVLWVSGRADAGSSEPNQPLLGQLLTTTSEDGTQYHRILAFRINGQHYPVTLFQAVEPDASCQTRHVLLAVTEATARSFEQPDVALAPPDPAGCGFGTIESLEPAPYSIPHQQVHNFCDLYRQQVPDWLGTATTALCDTRDPAH